MMHAREIDTSALEKADPAKLERRIRSGVGRAISDFNMIEDGDRVMVCLSGGADSYTLLDVLLRLQKAAPIEFGLVAVNLDQKQPGFPEQVLPEYLQSLGVEFRIVEEDTYSVVKRVIPEGQTTCSLCSRLRRGVLYNTAEQIGATKIALGHPADDIVETAFLKTISAMSSFVRWHTCAKARSSNMRRCANSRLFRAICAARNRISSARPSRRCCSNGIRPVPAGSTIS
jgi:tRNA(Ile)-lysidine synthase TilS/MesJ